MELILNKDNLKLIDLDALPGGRALYEELAEMFLKHYHDPEEFELDGKLSQ